MATGSQDDEPPWLTVPEAARRLGVTRQAISHRIRRGTLKTKPGNRGLLVQVPSGVAEATVAPIVDNGIAQRLSESTRLLSVELDRAHERVRRAEEKLDKAQADHVAAVARAERAEGRLEQAEREAERHRQEADRLRAEVEQARRPWWRRWRR
jgi:hypothetical protein